MTRVEQLASFVANSTYADISSLAIKAFKIRILDALRCAIGALEGEPVCRPQPDCAARMLQVRPLGPCGDL